MSEQYKKNKFNFLNSGGLFSMYQRTMHSFSDYENKNERTEIYENGENKNLEFMTTARSGIKNMNANTNTNTNINTNTNVRIGMGKEMGTKEQMQQREEREQREQREQAEPNETTVGLGKILVNGLRKGLEGLGLEKRKVIDRRVGTLIGSNKSQQLSYAYGVETEPLELFEEEELNEEEEEEEEEKFYNDEEGLYMGEEEKKKKKIKKRNFLNNNRRESREDKEDREKLKIIEKKLSNELIRSYYNNTCYFDKNPDYLNIKGSNKVNQTDHNIQHEDYRKSYLYPSKNDKHNGYCNSLYNYNKSNVMSHCSFDDINNIYKNKELLLNEETNTITNTNGNGKSNFSSLRDDENVYNELKKLKNDVTLLQMMNVNLQKQLISTHYINNANISPQHIIINNKTEVASNAINNIERENDKKNRGILYLLLKKILSSRFNQMVFISSILVSCFLINKQWQKALKVAQLEKKVNSNILLKSVKLLEETMGIRKVNYI